MYFRPSCSYFIDQNIMSALVYTLANPMLNPGTYDLQTKDVKEDVEKLRNKKWLHWKSIYLHACVFMCVHIYTHICIYIPTLHALCSKNGSFGFIWYEPITICTMFQPLQNVSFPNYSMLSFIPWRYMWYSLFVDRVTKFLLHWSFICALI